MQYHLELRKVKWPRSFSLREEEGIINHLGASLRYRSTLRYESYIDVNLLYLLCFDDGLLLTELR